MQRSGVGVGERKCKEVVRDRAGNRCERCTGLEHGISFHHRRKRSQGGLWTPGNIVLVCGHGTAGCHGFIESHPRKAAEEGWHVRPWEDPLEVPVKWQRSTWVLLGDDGGMEGLNV